MSAVYSDHHNELPIDFSADQQVAQLRVPPHSIEAESSVLGGLLLDNSAWDRMGDLLVDGDFYRHEHQLIYAAIGALINASKPADVITVFEQLQNQGHAEAAGGLGYLNSLAQYVPSASNIRRYAEIVRERSILRKLDDPMFLGPWRVPNWVPLRWRHAAWQTLDRWKLEPMARGALATLAMTLGAKPLEGSVFGDWIHSPDGGLALYDADFATLPRRLHGVLDAPSRRAQLHQVGFPNFEWAPADVRLAPKSNDSRPWVLFGGSAGTHTAATAYRLAQALVERSDRPCILLEPAQGAHASYPPADTTSVIRLPPQALPPLLLQAHAFVHHGGVGSCAQGLAAGVPQILIPRAYDQFENAAAIERKGAGWVMPGSLRHAPPERQADWMVARSGVARAAPLPSAYSTPHRPNAAVVAALRHLTAD